MGRTIMNDANRTLRFSRTAKEAFGHDIRFDADRPADKLVGWCMIFAYGFLAGFFLAVL